MILAGTLIVYYSVATSSLRLGIVEANQIVGVGYTIPVRPVDALLNGLEFVNFNDIKRLL